ncbi:MAG: PRC-barrel domain containing protein [Armatimonadetes bacterium]|nr:PRC-barrel domain containing protein [Armatimonadota bacterium]
MPPQRKTSTRQYAIGAGVMARDGIAGTLERIVVDPDDAQVVDLIVSVPRVGPDREVVVPATRVVHADADGIVVDLTTAEVRALPEFEAVRFRQPEAGWEGLPEHTPDVVLFWAPRRAVEAFVPPSVVPEPNVEGVRNIPPDAITLAAEMEVTCGHEVVGQLDRILLDPEGDHATHLVVRRGVLGTEERIVPVTQVDRVTEERVELRCDHQELDQMPRYRSN